MVQAQVVPRVFASQRQFGGIARRVTDAPCRQEVLVGSVWLPRGRRFTGVEACVDLFQDACRPDLVQGKWVVASSAAISSSMYAYSNGIDYALNLIWEKMKRVGGKVWRSKSGTATWTKNGVLKNHTLKKDMLRNEGKMYRFCELLLCRRINLLLKVVRKEPKGRASHVQKPQSRARYHPLAATTQNGGKFVMTRLDRRTCVEAVFTPEQAIEAHHLELAIAVATCPPVGVAPHKERLWRFAPCFCVHGARQITKRRTHLIFFSCVWVESPAHWMHGVYLRVRCISWDLRYHGSVAYEWGPWRMSSAHIVRTYLFRHQRAQHFQFLASVVFGAIAGSVIVPDWNSNGQHVLTFPIPFPWLMMRFVYTPVYRMCSVVCRSGRCHEYIAVRGEQSPTRISLIRTSPKL